MIPNQKPKVKARPFEFSDFEIFKRIWVQPRLVFSYVDEFRHDHFTIVLLFLTAVVTSLELAIFNNMGEGMSLSFILGLCVFIGGVFGTVVFYFYAAIASWIGEWFEGNANIAAVARVISHAMFPMLLVLIITSVKISVFGPQLFKEDVNLAHHDSGTAAFYIISSTIQLALAIWSLCLIVVGFSQVQRLPLGKSFLNVMIPAAILAAVVGMICFPFL